MTILFSVAMSLKFEFDELRRMLETSLYIRLLHLL